MTSDTQNGDGKESLNALLHAELSFTQHTQLQRFIERAVTDLHSLGGDQLVCQWNQKKGEVVLSKEGAALKHTALAPEWCAALNSWLCQRGWVFSAGIAGLPHFSQEKKEISGWCAAKIGENVAVFYFENTLAVRGIQCFKLSKITLSPFSQAQLLFCPGDYLEESFERLRSMSAGIVLVSATQATQLQAVVGASAVLLQAHVAGPLDAKHLEAALLLAAESAPCILYYHDGEVLESLMKASSLDVEGWIDGISAVLTGGVVKKNCEYCAFEKNLDPTITTLLPEGLRPSEGARVAAGKGCGQCGGTGKKGAQTLMSLLVFDDFTRTLFAREKEEKALLEELYPRGLKPLIEDGVRKMTRGKVAPEEVFTIVKNAPSAYTELLKKAGPYRNFSSGSPEQRENLNSSTQKEKALILAVEDDPDQRAILEMVFKAADYELMTATNGVEALSLLKSRVPDLIVSDLMMPKMDGREFITRLKLDPQLRKIPVLILTVLNDSDKEYDLLELGADDYCEKTMHRKVLLKRIENLLKRK